MPPHKLWPPPASFPPGGRCASHGGERRAGFSSAALQNGRPDSKSFNLVRDFPPNSRLSSQFRDFPSIYRERPSRHAVELPGRIGGPNWGAGSGAESEASRDLGRPARSTSSIRTREMPALLAISGPSRIWAAIPDLTETGTRQETRPPKPNNSHMRQRRHRVHPKSGLRGSVRLALERFLAYFGLWPDPADPSPTRVASCRLPLSERSDPSVRAATPSNATRRPEPIARKAASQRTTIGDADARDRALSH